jgi:hypothetical protein
MFNHHRAFPKGKHQEGRRKERVMDGVQEFVSDLDTPNTSM